MVGLARSNPKEALTIAAEPPVGIWPDRIRLILENANQTDGLHGGEALLLEDNNQIPPLFKSVLFEQISAKAYGRLAVRNLPAEALPWLEPYVGQYFINSRGLADFVSMAVLNSGPDTLAWLDQHTDRMTPTQADAAYMALGRSWHERKPEQFLEWVKTNGRHPHLATIIASTPVGSLNQ